MARNINALQLPHLRNSPYSSKQSNCSWSLYYKGISLKLLQSGEPLITWQGVHDDWNLIVFVWYDKVWLSYRFGWIVIHNWRIKCPKSRKTIVEKLNILKNQENFDILDWNEWFMRERCWNIKFWHLFCWSFFQWNLQWSSNHG